MDSFVERMITESDELKIKIDKAVQFMCTDTFETLTSDEKYMLQAQVRAMRKYYEILNNRISYYTN